MYKFYDGVLITDLKDIEPETDCYANISENTVNTWQPGRSSMEKDRDTKQGKIAEAVTEKYLSQYSANQYLSYDKIRNDDYQKHAPCDGFIITESCSHMALTCFINMVQEEIQRTSVSYVELGERIRSFAHSNGIYFVEIKSTKVNSRKKLRAGFVTYDNDDQVFCLIKQIVLDDFLTYPHFLRYGNIETTSQYIDFLVNKGYIDSHLSQAEQKTQFVRLENECALPDIFIRVYIDEEMGKAFLIGYISKENFIDENVQIKKMIQPGKSEGAVYLAKSLKYGSSIKDL